MISGIPRRASAYDVYHKRGSDAGALIPNKNEMIPGRRSSFRTPSANDKEDPALVDPRRRSSCRAQIGGTSDEYRQPVKPKPMTDLAGKLSICLLETAKTKWIRKLVQFGLVYPILDE